MQDPRLAAELAQAAARLIVDEGEDWRRARRKAAESLGLDARRAPHLSDEALEDAVREHIALFCAQEQSADLAALRALALQWMRRLAAFDPHLRGAAWRGTATRRSPILIDLYSDDAKAPELALLNMGVTVEAGDGGTSGGEGAQPVLSVSDRLPVQPPSAQGLGEAAADSRNLGRHTLARGPQPFEWVGIHFFVNDDVARRSALKPDARGQSWRGSLAQLAALMSETGPLP